MGIGNVGPQLEEFTGIVLAIVHALGQQVELFGIIDHVGVVGIVASALHSPVDGIAVRGTDGGIAVAHGQDESVGGIAADGARRSGIASGVAGGERTNVVKSAAQGDGLPEDVVRGAAVGDGGICRCGDARAHGERKDGHGAVVGGDIAILAAFVDGIRHAGYGAVAVVVAPDGAGTVGMAHDGSVIITAGFANVGTDDKVIGHGALVEARDAAAVSALFATDVTDCNRTGTILDCAAIRGTRTVNSVATHDAAKKLGDNIRPCADDGDLGRGLAAVNGTAFVPAHNTGAVTTSGDTGIVENDVLHLSTTAYQAEETEALTCFGAIDADAADGHTVAVEVTAEVTAIGGSARIKADGGVVVLLARGVVPCGGGSQSCVRGLVEVEVVHQLEVLAFVVRAAVHVGGQLVQVVDGFDLVGLS